MYTLEARCAFLDDFNGGRHGVLEKIVNDQVFLVEGPSDGFEVHPAILATEPATYWHQSTQELPRNPSLESMG